MRKRIALLLMVFAAACSVPTASAFDPKPGRYKGTLKVTTSFPGTDVKQSVVQKVMGRLAPTGQMVIAIPNTLDGIEEEGGRAAFLFFNSPTDNGCFVKLLKDNFVDLPSVTANRITVDRVVTVNTTDAKNSAISYTVTTELTLARVAP